jgi:hypothetical protein
LFARAYGISKEQLEVILSKPHGLRSLMTGKYHFPAHADADHRRNIALELAVLFSDHLVNDKGNYEDIYFAFKRYLREAKKYHNEQDAAIKEENTFIALVHKVIAKDMEDERLGRVKLDTLSEKERNALMKMGIKAEMKKVEKDYWFHIGVLVATGLTKEEAREKMCQDLLEKGDIKSAKLLREFQDLVHLVKPNSEEPLKLPDQPPSSS